MEFFSRFGLEFNPFLKNAEEIPVDTKESREAAFRLGYPAKNKGFGLLAGAAGRGKTTAARRWKASLNPSLYKAIYQSLSTLAVNDFYRSPAEKLGLQPSFRKPGNFKAIQKETTRLAMEKRRIPVFIIDEANYVSNAILNDLKLLFNFGMDSKDRAVILLAGLPQLNSTLRLGVHEPLRQRIIMNYNMEGITKEEGRTYIPEKLKGAGAAPDVFEDNAVEAVLNAADGTPRMISMINKLCNAGMLVAASR